MNEKANEPFVEPQQKPPKHRKNHHNVPDAGITFECFRNRKKTTESRSSWEVRECLELMSGM